MSNKADKIAAKLAELGQGATAPPGMHPCYAGYFTCFNQGHYYEAHDVLEHLWLPQRGGPNDLFYKGLIQLAGAFVHLQKNRLGPAAALFKLARKNLRNFPPAHERLDTLAALALIEAWLARLEQGGGNPLTPESRPALELRQE